jgi:hypothetical protein
MKTHDSASRMIPYRIDPTLHPAPPSAREIGDGFEPRLPPPRGAEREAAATRPGPDEPGQPPEAPERPPLPARQPVEPEFAPRDAPSDPQDAPLRAPPQP